MGGPNCTNVCFHYVPPRLRGKEEDAEWWKELSAVPPKLKEAMVREGSRAHTKIFCFELLLQTIIICLCQHVGCFMDILKA